MKIKRKRNAPRELAGKSKRLHASERSAHPRQHRRGRQRTGIWKIHHRVYEIRGKRLVLKSSRTITLRDDAAPVSKANPEWRRIPEPEETDAATVTFPTLSCSDEEFSVVSLRIGAAKCKPLNRKSLRNEPPPLQTIDFHPRNLPHMHPLRF